MATTGERTEDLSAKNGSSGRHDGIAAILEEARSELDQWSNALLQLGRVQIERARLAILDGLVGVVLAVAIVLTVATALVVATLLSILGLASAITEATGSAWLGNLVGGLLVLAALALAGWYSLRSLRRAELDRVRRRLPSAGSIPGPRGREGPSP